ncbi:MAG: YggU family protein [Deltaproteobacteria bacterium]|nr:YggU family protein [Deltaproteobacteria bacterium]
MKSVERPFLKVQDQLCTLHVQVVPRAKKSKICGIHADKLKIAVAAPALEGRANQELVKFLAKLLDCAKSKIKVQKGEHSRDKVISVEGVDLELLLGILDEALSSD